MSSYTTSRELLEGWGTRVGELSVEARDLPRLVVAAGTGDVQAVAAALAAAQDLADKANALFAEFALADLVPGYVSHVPGEREPGLGEAQ